MRRWLLPALLGLLAAGMVTCTRPEPLPTPTPSPVPAPTRSLTPTPAGAPTGDLRLTPAPTTTAVPSPTATPSPTPTATGAPSPTATPSPTPAATAAPPPTATPTPAPAFQATDHPLRSARLIISDDALWAGHPASRTVTRLGLPGGGRDWQTDVGCEPATLARSNSRLFVACFDSGEVLVIDERSGEILTRKSVGHGPFGVLAAAGRVYLTLAHEEAVLALRADTLDEISRARTGRQPRGLGLKGDRLYVVHLLDAGVRVLDAESLEPLGGIRIGFQAALAESLTLHPDRARAYVPHQRQNVTNMALLFDSTVFPVVSALDTEELRPVRREALALDTVDVPVSMPIAVVLSSDGTRLYAANAASDDISVVDLAQGLGAGHILVGRHPRDLALSPDGERLYSLNLVSDDISVVEVDTLAVVDTFDLADDPRPSAVQEGERIWLTSRPDEISRDNWMACASCHFDTGFDGRTWLGVEGGPRNTPVVRGIAGTEPLHWSADRPNVQSFQETFTGLMAGTGLSEAELDALAAYLNGLQPLASPRRNRDGSLTEAAVSGASVFRRAGCAVCHSPPQFTDRQLHDVGTGEPFHDHPSGSGKVAETMGSAFDTPSLRELWLTAPYLHDGRAPTLRDVLTTFNLDGRHGRTSALSEEKLSAVEAFLMSLPLTEAELSALFAE